MFFIVKNSYANVLQNIRNRENLAEILFGPCGPSPWRTKKWAELIRNAHSQEDAYFRNLNRYKDPCRDGYVRSLPTLVDLINAKSMRWVWTIDDEVNQFVKSHYVFCPNGDFY